jgi:hypothetical protein
LLRKSLEGRSRVSQVLVFPYAKPLPLTFDE